MGVGDGGESSARDARLARRHEERRRVRREEYIEPVEETVFDDPETDDD